MFRWLSDNLGTLLLSFILAVMVWFVVARETNPILEQVFEEPIPVQYVNQPAGVVFTDASGVEQISRPERSIQVTIQGPKTILDSLRVSDFTALVDLSAVPLGGVDVPVEVVLDNPHVSIVEQDSRSIFIRMEPFVRETFEIVPLVSVEPALGHVAGTVVVSPSEVTLEGPQPLVEPVETAQVRVSIRDVQQTWNDTVRVELRDSDGRQVTGFPLEDLLVGVTVPITKSDEYAELFVTVDLTGTLATGYRLADYTIEPERVTIFGSPDVVSALPNFVSTFPVDMSGADGDLIQRVGLKVPVGATLIGAQNVVVEIDVEPVLTTLTFPWRPQIFGPDPGLSATISLDSINVSMIGPLALIDSFNPETDLSLTLNLYGMEPGAYEVEPAALSNVLGVEVESILPPNILVEIFELPTPTPTPTPTSTLTTTLPLTTTLIPSPLATPTVTLTPGPVFPPMATPTPTVTPKP